MRSHRWSKVQKLTEVREKRLRARIRQAGGLDRWMMAIYQATASDFLCGRGATPFRATFDFFLQETSFQKLLEGAYDHAFTPQHRGGRAAPRLEDDPVLRAGRFFVDSG